MIVDLILDVYSSIVGQIGVWGNSVNKYVLIFGLILSGCVSHGGGTSTNQNVRPGNTSVNIDGVKISVGVSKPYVTSIIYRERAPLPEADFELANRAAEKVVGCRGIPNVEQYEQVNADPQSITVVQVLVSC